MQSKKRLYLYPFTKATTREGGNTYIPNLIHYLSSNFKVVNDQTSLGLLDIVLKLPQCDVLYFNWIEDVADKKFGAVQVFLLAWIVLLAKVFDIKIVWFVHNNLSHKKKNLWLKKSVVALMQKGADVILSHSSAVRLTGSKRKIRVFDHPVEAYNPVFSKEPYRYDLLIWGTVNPYKGVEEFLRFNRTASVLQQYKILIAGKFASPEYYEKMTALKVDNITIENKILSEAELTRLFSECRCVLFTYNSASVLSSAALSKTLSFGKTIIGPQVGAFEELGDRELIYNYTSFENLETLLTGLPLKEAQPGYSYALEQYIAQHSWPAFIDFIADALSETKKTSFKPVL